MPFKIIQGTKYFHFQSLSAAGFPHGIFTRQGGLSPAPWDSLNAGLKVGDEPRRVAENTRRALSALGRPDSLVRMVRQVHGSVVVVHGSSPESAEIPEADGIVTDRRDLTLSMRYADCVPLLLADPENRAVAIGHAGWRGSVRKIATEIVRKMTELYGSRPEGMLAGLGPAICVDHYEIGTDVAEEVQSAFGQESEQVLRRRNGRTYFDLWHANRLAFHQAGVTAVETAAICTLDGPDDWFSHRGENGRTGRFLVLIGID